MCIDCDQKAVVASCRTGWFIGYCLCTFVCRMRRSWTRMSVSSRNAAGLELHSLYPGDPELTSYSLISRPDVFLNCQFTLLPTIAICQFVTNGSVNPENLLQTNLLLRLIRGYSIFIPLTYTERERAGELNYGSTFFVMQYSDVFFYPNSKRWRYSIHKIGCYQCCYHTGITARKSNLRIVDWLVATDKRLG